MAKQVSIAQGLRKYNKELSVDLLTAMYEEDADFTNTFRALGGVSAQPADTDADGVPASLQKVSHALFEARTQKQEHKMKSAYHQHLPRARRRGGATGG